MRKQLQQTTVVVLVLLLSLIGALYVVNNYALPGSTSQLTAATVSVDTIDCNQPLPVDASTAKQKKYREQCFEQDL